LKTIVLLNIFVKNGNTFYSGIFDDYKVQKSSIYFKIEIFCNIINGFTATFEQLSMSLLIKIIHVF